jgi:hypothetical protein
MAGHSADDRADGVVAAKNELYGLPLGQFTAVRAELAKQARADGDRDAAAVIAKLPKPNVVAWLANQLARQHPDDLRPLLDLGVSLRQATADLDAARLGELSRDQRQVVSALTGRARELAGEAGQAVSDSTVRGLQDTLHAALADEQAAEDLARGQLAAGLSRTGFPGLDAAASADDLTAVFAAPARATGSGRKATTARSDAPAASAGSTQRTRKAADRREEAARAAAEARRQQLERARRAEAEVRAHATEADRDQERAGTALADAESAAQQAEQNIGRLQDELDAALDARNNAGRAQRQARKDADRADRTARQAARRLAEATSRREQLERDA